MGRINGVPHPRGGDWFSKPGGPNWSSAFGSGGKKSGGCAITLFGFLAAPWLLDLLLTSSQATG